MGASRTIAVISMLASVIIWGLAIVCMKVSVDSFPPMALNLLRFGSAALFLFVVLRVREKSTRIKKEDIWLLVITGVLGISIYYYFASIAMNYISASSAGIIAGTIPIFTLIGESAFFKRRIRAVDLISILMSVAGLYLVIGGGEKGLNSVEHICGYLLMVLAVLSWVAYTLLTGRLADKYSGLASVTYQTVFGAAFFIPFTIFELTDRDTLNKVLSITERADDLKVIFANMLFMGILSSAIGYCLYIYGMKVIGVSASSLFLNLSPVATLTASYFILKETFAISQLAGSFLVLLSVIIINFDFYNCRRESAAYQNERPGE
jgi:drug/metabolite transporter (DMT)-like permease